MAMNANPRATPQLEAAPNSVAAGERVILTLKGAAERFKGRSVIYGWDLPIQGQPAALSATGQPVLLEGILHTQFESVVWDTADVPPGTYEAKVRVWHLDPDQPHQALVTHARNNPPAGQFTTRVSVRAAERATGMAEAAMISRAGRPPGGVPLDRQGFVPVSLQRAQVPPTADQALWSVIRKSAEALSFANYSRFMEVILCGADPREVGLNWGANDVDQVRKKRDEVKHRLRLPFPDTDPYRQLKVATEVFVMLNCGVAFQDKEEENEAVGSALKGPLKEDDVERIRYNRPLWPGEIEQYWQDLLAEGDNEAGIRTVLYLALIRKKLGDVTVVSRSKLKRSIVLQREEAAVACMEIIMEKLTHPCLLELIWSYWHEEGMLVQTMNAISWRFQNRRGPADRDPLAMVEIDPLRPLNNFIWGYIQDEQHRLTVPRRAYEYDHHYGLKLLGKAVPVVQGADSRSRFLEAFHNLLYVCAIFFKEDDDTTVVADGFPVLNALKEVHLLLTQGAHNQYGDLPWTARHEMLMQQWLLARPEMREFLPSRIMVDYPEPWMDRVETMKTLQAWTDASILHFRDLGVFGEQILLGARFGAWPSVIYPQQAANWARYWRPEIQGYIHAYRAVTGVDLTDRPDNTLPAALLQRRATPLTVPVRQVVR